MKNNDLPFTWVFVTCVLLLIAIMGENVVKTSADRAMSPATLVPPVAAENNDIQKLLETFANKGIRLQDAKYWKTVGAP